MNDAKRYGKGSAKWMRVLVNEQNEFLKIRIYESLCISEGEILWFSPLLSENFKEYSIQTILNRENVTLNKRTLSSFWPQSGPKWDAIGKSEEGTFFLVEAKSYIKEMIKADTGSKNLDNQRQIENSLNEARDFFNPSRSRTWPTTFYQFANRLAFIYLLKQLNKIPAYMLFINFTNDTTQNESPSSPQEWEGAYKLLKYHFGIDERRYAKLVNEMIIDVDELNFCRCT